MPFSRDMKAPRSNAEPSNVSNLTMHMVKSVGVKAPQSNSIRHSDIIVKLKRTFCIMYTVSFRAKLCFRRAQKTSASEVFHDLLYAQNIGVAPVTTLEIPDFHRPKTSELHPSSHNPSVKLSKSRFYNSFVTASKLAVLESRQ